MRLKPNLGHAFYNLGQLASRGLYRFNDDEITTSRPCSPTASSRSSTRASCISPSPTSWTSATAFDEAFAHYRQGNDLRQEYLQREARPSIPKRHLDTVHGVIAAFDRAYFDRTRSFGVDSELPVFIVGMPRSGTTLVEQILSSHPQVHGSGELLEDSAHRRRPAGLVDTRRQSYPACMSRIDRGLPRSPPSAISDSSPNPTPTSFAITDKMPRNRRHLGFIYTMFPKAHIIHCNRDPLDTCVSCYFQHFENLNLSNSLEDIALIYRLCEKLLAHWRAVLPTRIFEVQYEELVEHQEAVSRNLLAFCGLAWDDRCLAFHKTERAVQTASSVQVRQPIYRTSIGRWKRYEPHLQPLIQALARKD